MSQPFHVAATDQKTLSPRIQTNFGKKMKISPDLIPNSEAKEIVKPKIVRANFVTTPKTKSTRRTPKKIRKKDDQ